MKKDTVILLLNALVHVRKDAKSRAVIEVYEKARKIQIQRKNNKPK